LHCAPLVHKKLGTLDTGLIRISLSALSGKRDADIFYSALKGILY
jgi:selenocysteine lyase/cysteine desulfurase